MEAMKSSSQESRPKSRDARFHMALCIARAICIVRVSRAKHPTLICDGGSTKTRFELVVPRTRLQLGNLAFFGGYHWLVRSPGTVYHWTFVRHLHNQLLKTCSRHICFLDPTSVTNCFQSTSSEHCAAPL